MKQIVNEIGKGKNLDANLPKYATNLISLYNRFSRVHLTMNYFSCYEVITENQSENSAEIRKMMKELNRIISEVMLPGKCGEELVAAVATVDNMRNNIIHKMQILTAYTDIFNIYEYVMNRVEYRFVHGHLPKNYSDEEFCRDIMKYILKDNDNSVINLKITEVIRQLPLRMAKGKFFELLEGGMSIYKGNAKSSLDDFMYMLRTSAMLDLPEGFEESYADLYSIYCNMKEADYSSLTAEQYENLSQKLEYATVFLQDIVDMYVMFTELVNDVYAILLSAPYAITDVEETNICNSVIAAVNSNLEEGVLDPLGDEVTDMLIMLEGKQERLSETYMSIEYILDDIKNNHSDMVSALALNSVYNSLYRIAGLISGSLFVEFKDNTEGEDIADEAYVDAKKRQLTEDLSKLFGENNRAVNRAVMAAVLSELPVFFNNITELQDYIYNSLSGCRDEAEKIACHEVLMELMESQD